MDPCKNEDPLVIDQYIIEKCIQDLFPKGEAGRLTREEGIPLDEVQEIRIEFLRIIRIDHLWPLTSLTKLSLSNNLIEKIENLEELVNLVELDLSFNKITKIENLDTLVNIESFTVYNNFISTIENMDAFKKLAIFSIGKNRILNRDNILYLRRFRNLKSFNMAGNPCAKEEDFRIFVVAFLPQITYYEYIMVNDGERILGMETYSTKIVETEELEVKLLQQQQKEEGDIAEATLHQDSFVEFLGSSDLFDSLFEEDNEGKALLHIGEEMKEYYAEYSVQFQDITKQIFELGQEQYSIRRHEVNQFLKCVETEKQKNQQESIDCMDGFTEKKNQLMGKLKKLQEVAENGDIPMEDYSDRCQTLADEFSELISVVWKKLMGLEMTLFEQMEEANSTFEHSLTELINSFLETVQGFFSELRVLETTYAENVRECANRYMTTLNLNEDIIVHPELKPYICDKETLNNSLGATHDLHLVIIDAREDKLLTRARAWLSKLINNSQKDEIARSRMKVLDINHFLDLQREDFDDYLNLPIGMPVDAEH